MSKGRVCRILGGHLKDAIEVVDVFFAFHAWLQRCSLGPEPPAAHWQPPDREQLSCESRSFQPVGSCATEIGFAREIDSWPRVFVYSNISPSALFLHPHINGFLWKPHAIYKALSSGRRSHWRAESNVPSRGFRQSPWRRLGFPRGHILPWLPSHWREAAKPPHHDFCFFLAPKYTKGAAASGWEMWASALQHAIHVTQQGYFATKASHWRPVENWFGAGASHWRPVDFYLEEVQPYCSERWRSIF